MSDMDDEPVNQREYRERAVGLARHLALADEAELTRTLRLMRIADPKLCAQVIAELLRLGES
jgi:hypothetical protein